MSINVFAYTTLTMRNLVGQYARHVYSFKSVINQSIASPCYQNPWNVANTDTLYYYCIIIIKLPMHSWIIQFQRLPLLCPVEMIYTFPYVLSLLLHWCAIHVCYIYNIVKLVHDNTNGEWFFITYKSKITSGSFKRSNEQRYKRVGESILENLFFSHAFINNPTERKGCHL